jgi:hypothetical protein
LSAFKRVEVKFPTPIFFCDPHIHPGVVAWNSSIDFRTGRESVNMTTLQRKRKPGTIEHNVGGELIEKLRAVLAG